MTRSIEIGELAKALAAAQGEIRVAPKDNIAKTEKYSYAYSTLADVWEACRAALSKNGLSVVQTTEAEGTKASVTTLLLHTSGQWIENTLTLSGKDASPQSVGGCITYARRYALGSMVGVVSEEDDDGNDAAGRDARTSRKPSNGHTGNGERPAPVPAKPAEPAKEDPSVAICTAIKARILKCPSVSDMVKLDTEIADAHKAHSINDKQKAWLGEIVAARLKDVRTLQENAA